MTRTLASLKESFVLEAHSAPIQSIAFGPDPELYSTGDVLRTAKIWHRGNLVRELNLTSRHDKIRPTERIRGLQFSPDGSTLYTACGDSFRANEVISGDIRWSYRPPRSFGFLIVSPIAVGVSQSGEVAIATDAGRLSVWTAAGALKSHWSDNDSPRQLAFVGEDHLIGTDSFSFSCWRASTGRKQNRERLKERAFGFASTPSGDRYVLRTIHEVSVHDFANVEVIDRYPLDFGPPLVAISEDGTRVAYSGVNDIYIRAVGSDAHLRLPILSASARSLRFLPGGKGVVAGCSDGSLRFWDI